MLWVGVSITAVSPTTPRIKNANRSSLALANRKGSNGRLQRRAVVWISFRPSQPRSVGEALWLFYARLQDSIKEIDAWLSVTAEDVLSPRSLQ